ncbi:MAG: hypothetical protein GQ530_06945 [Desulfuromonadales bacterium]|nr:hypothetical protein [Desulfuromonadales bacterium]
MEGKCCHEYLFSFSCKGRWFCPSCHAKKVLQFGELQSANILSSIPRRQYVLPLPKNQHIYCKYDRKLLNLPDLFFGR